MTKILQVYVCVTKAELISAKLVDHAGCYSFCRDRYANWQLYIVSCFFVFLTLAARKCSRYLYVYSRRKEMEGKPKCFPKVIHTNSMK